MKQNIFSAIHILLLIISSVFIAMCYRKKISWVTDHKQLFITIVGLGVILCMIGIMLRVVGPYKYADASQWVNIFLFIHAALGIIALVIIYLGFSQKEFLFIKDYLSASNALSIVIILKILTSVVKSFMNR